MMRRSYVITTYSFRNHRDCYCRDCYSRYYCTGSNTSRRTRPRCRACSGRACGGGSRCSRRTCRRTKDVTGYYKKSKE